LSKVVKNFYGQWGGKQLQQTRLVLLPRLMQREEKKKGWGGAQAANGGILCRYDHKGFARGKKTEGEKTERNEERVGPGGERENSTLAYKQCFFWRTKTKSATLKAMGKKKRREKKKWGGAGTRKELGLS